ncbi:MAG: metallophosphoesterase [Planctomycetota bacterium]
MSRSVLIVCLLSVLGSSVSAQTSQKAGPIEKRALRFAVIGDYGEAGAAEAAVAEVVHRFDPDLVITAGDNNYPVGAAATIDQNIGQYYARYIGSYLGSYGSGILGNRFFPTLGNHDWLTPGAAPYLAYFTLPGNERYYDVRRGPLHLFAIDSDPHEPDGIDAASVQAIWLQNALAASSAPFKVVAFHHTPYSSAEHGSNKTLQWPFKAWGADLILAGHDHTYERIEIGGLPILVDGLGGRSRYAFEPTIFGSQARFNAADGPLLGWIEEDRMTIQFVTTTGFVMDTTTIVPSAIPPIETELVGLGSTWSYLDDGTDQGTAWTAPAFDDSLWATGPAELGYGDGDEATVVSFGPNSSAKYITTYFRHAFSVASPSAFDVLWLRAVRDDGVVVYLNGTEVYRSNLPETAIDFSTPASVAVGSNEEEELYGVEIPASALVAGQNVLAVEIHQSDGTSSDISFDLRLTGVSGRVTRVPRGATWSYFDQGVDLGTAWREPAFNDSLWSSGPAELGYGDGDEATVVSFGPDVNDKYPTTYFRHGFSVGALETIQAARLRLVRDDGVVVYLNGTEVYRSNIKAGEVLYSSYAAFPISGNGETEATEILIDPRLIVPGQNLLAVEIHQQRPDSSDLSFDCELFTW